MIGSIKACLAIINYDTGAARMIDYTIEKDEWNFFL
jgi:hypothetical protein